MLVDELEYPVDDLLKLCRDISHFNEDSIHDSGHGQLIEVDRYTSVEGTSVGSVDEREVLHCKTIDTPKVVPPLKE